ncbi:3-oxoacyl-[acyl-carrier-protein] reductase FabG [Mycena venus]|uniref:3-oxoacyl-[acyl-carrier-protein] reductase n=1 Tax=Mycena venus TaxID=2733690 RepID=A0A8H6XGR3_9AGAR|nr:3-oxoacyl-[acyl-carrier-protein] reductase FabG [Mycena venus]
MSDRLAQVSQHLSNAHGRGLLAGEVAIITGAGQIRYLHLQAVLIRLITMLVGHRTKHSPSFAKEGAKVVIRDIDAKRFETVRDEIKAAGGDFLAVAGDVGADDFPKKIVDATVEKYGKINHIVNNAGFTFDKMLHTTPEETFDIIIKSTSAAPYFRLKVRFASIILPLSASSPSMTTYTLTSPLTQPDARKNRSIINVSSISGLHASVGQANCTAARAAAVGLTKTIAKEWGPRVWRACKYDCAWVDSYEVRARPFTFSSLPLFNPPPLSPPTFFASFIPLVRLP